MNEFESIFPIVWEDVENSLWYDRESFSRWWYDIYIMICDPIDQRAMAVAYHIEDKINWDFKDWDLGL